MKKVKNVWVAIITFMIGAGLYGYYILNSLSSYQETSDQNHVSLETSVARLGDLTVSISCSGQVVPASEFGLDFNETGTITDILINVGDQVQAGDVLLRLKSSQSELELAAAIAEAELAFVQAQAALDDLYATAEVEAAQALIELEDAQIALNDLMDLESEKALAAQRIAQAQEDIAKAEMMLYIYHASPSEEDIYTAYASYLFKQEDLDRLEKQRAIVLKSIRRARDQAQRTRAETQLYQLDVQLANQQIAVENALYRMETIDQATNQLDIAVAEAQLATAQARLSTYQKELAALQDGPNAGEVAMAEARLADAQAEWDRLRDGPDPNDVALAETRVEKARLSLALSRQNTPYIDLVAPFDGIVTSVNTTLGSRVNEDTESSGSESDPSGDAAGMQIFDPFFPGNTNSSKTTDQSLITLADLSQPLVEIYIDETDFEKVALGYTVKITLDALPNEIFTGKIIEVHPSLETVSNVTAQVALVRLDPDSYTKPNTLFIGMNAQVEVIAGGTSNAVLVPIEALVQVEQESYTIYVIEGNQPVRREVTVGLMDFTTAEIITGLSAGETVVLGYENTTGN